MPIVTIASLTSSGNFPIINSNEATFNLHTGIGTNNSYPFNTWSDYTLNNSKYWISIEDFINDYIIYGKKIHTTSEDGTSEDRLLLQSPNIEFNPAVFKAVFGDNAAKNIKTVEQALNLLARNKDITEIKTVIHIYKNDKPPTSDLLGDAGDLYIDTSSGQVYIYTVHYDLDDSIIYSWDIVPTESTVDSIIDEKIEKAFKYTNENKVPDKIGGIDIGDTFDNISIKDIITKLLYPHKNPTITATASPCNGGLFEKGDTADVYIIDVNITKGTEDIASVNLSNGDVDYGTITDLSDINTNDEGKIQFKTTLTIIDTMILTITVTDITGEKTIMNMNSYMFVDPFYYGGIDNLDDINNITIQSLNKKIESRSNKTYLFNTDNQYMILAYPAIYNALVDIYDQNNFNIKNAWNMTFCNIINKQGTVVKYIVYTSSNKITLHDFKITFKFN